MQNNNIKLLGSNHQWLLQQILYNNIIQTVLEQWLRQFAVRFCDCSQPQKFKQMQQKDMNKKIHQIIRITVKCTINSLTKECK